MTDELKTQCEKSFYSELYHFEEDSQNLVIDDTTGRISLKKSLDTYDISVYDWLRSHHDKHIPIVHTFWEEDGRLAVLEEYIQGETLEEKLSKGLSNKSEKLRIITEVCDALSFLHNAPIPIIHRDIKASNIMLTNDGVVKLIDYDAAKTFHAGKKSDTALIGTVGSAAPEQYGFRQSDARTDIYSLGILIKELFPDDKRFAKIINKATQMEPGFRYQNTQELKRALTDAAGISKKKSHIWIVVIICTIAYMAIAGIIVVLLLRHFTNVTKADSVNNSYENQTTEPASAISISDSKANVMPYSEPSATQDTDKSTLEPINKTNTDREMTNAIQGNSNSKISYGLESDKIIIEESYWSMSSSGDFISYAVVITNKDTDLAIESPSVQAVARNGDSEVLGTDRAGGFYILPKDHIIVSGLIALPDSYTSDGISMEFVLSSSGAANMSPSDYPGSNSFVVSNITAHRDELFPNVTGEITSSHTKTVDSVMLTAVIRLNGEIVETEYTFIDDLEPNVPMAFEIDLSGDLTDYDSMEVWAQNWS